MTSIRRAELRDVSALAALHHASATEQPGGFLHRLGRGFLKTYYDVSVADSRVVILCAVSDDNEVIGFVSGSLDARARMSSLRRNSFRFVLPLAMAAVRNPRLIVEAVGRAFSRGIDESGSGYVVQQGAREEYWAVDSAARGGAIGLLLHLKWLRTMRELGASTIRLETDVENARIMDIHRRLGAVIESDHRTPDGRQRLVLVYRTSDVGEGVPAAVAPRVPRE